MVVDAIKTKWVDLMNPVKYNILMNLELPPDAKLNSQCWLTVFKLCWYYAHNVIVFNMLWETHHEKIQIYHSSKQYLKNLCYQLYTWVDA